MKSSDYALTKEQVNELKGMTCLPHEFRVMLLKKFLEKHKPEDLVELFSQFIGMANSVEENTREFIELYLVTECNHTDKIAAMINLPTVFGALFGAEVAIKPTKGMCGTCAFRLGTFANQSPVTSHDAKWSSETDCKFMCHEDLDEHNEPTKPCAGYAKVHGLNFAGVKI